MDARVAGRYGQALFSAALKADAVARVEADLDVILGALAENVRFRKFMMSPVTDRRQKSALLDKVFGAEASPLTMSALKLMVEKRREAEMQSMSERFRELRRLNDNVLFVHVTSRAEVSAEMRQSLTQKLEGQTGKRIEATFELDPNILGGIRVAYDNYVLDGTVRGRLSRLRDRLRSEFRSA